MAVARLHTPPEHYTGAIVDALAAEHHSSHPIPSLAIVGSVRDIEERIKTMLTPGKTFRTRPTLTAAIIASLLALATVPTALVLTVRGQTPPPMQAAAPPTVDSEQTEQPRFAARTFNSDLSFDVYAQDTYSPVKELIGHIPSAVPLKIPTCWMWQVQPIGPVEDWNLLIREIDREEIPGLMLRGVEITDSELKKLAGLARLRSLDLGLTGGRPIRQITDAGWESLKGMSHLEQLNLQGTGIADGGLEHVWGLTSLQDL